MKDREHIPAPFPDPYFERFGLLPIEVDPFGSYSGVPKNLTEKPVQDADDL